MHLSVNDDENFSVEAPRVRGNPELSENQCLPILRHQADLLQNPASFRKCLFPG
jgi:hypothetical protein